jgi:hypothetical protein
MTVRWLTAMPVVATAVVLAGCGTTNARSTGTTANKPAVLEPTPAGTPTSCTGYGTSWLRAYNRTALRQSSPIRMVSACCGPVTEAGRHHCLLKVTLVGTKQVGCETVDLGADGTPATIGRHEACAPHK